MSANGVRKIGRHGRNSTMKSIIIIIFNIHIQLRKIKQNNQFVQFILNFNAD